MNEPTLEDNSFVDKAIGNIAISLWERPDGGVTNAIQLLVRPLDIRCDESGRLPGEDFVMVTITREELRAMLVQLDEDWEEMEKHCGELNNS